MTKIKGLELSEKFTLEELNERYKNTLAGHLAIEFIEIGNDFLKSRMPVDHRTHQPLGLLNGGASLALAETTASLAANLWLDRTKQVALGLEINGNHLHSVKSGFVYATATPVHKGKTTQVWDVKIEDEEGKTVCLSRLTLANVDVK